jgi:hypothetical protein
VEWIHLAHAADQYEAAAENTNESSGSVTDG